MGKKRENEISQIVLMALIEQAEKNQHSKFRFINSLEDKFLVKNTIRGIDKICAYFRNICIAAKQKYLESSPILLMNSDSIIFYKKSQEYLNFYQEEKKIYKNMLKEFKAYSRANLNGIKLFFGHTRSEAELVDYRKLKFDWNPFHICKK